MKSLYLALFLAAQSDSVYGAAYTYTDNGVDWETDDNPACKNGKRQSPIDLKTDMDGVTEKSFFKHYENVDFASANDAVKATDYGKTYFKGAKALYLNLDISGLTGSPAVYPESPTWFATPNYFISSKAADYEGKSDTPYYAKQLHFHTQSEHAIDGKLTDLEMHIVHQNSNADAGLREIKNEDLTVQDIKYPYGYIGVVGILFDKTNYGEVSAETVEAIDKFFDTLMMHQVKKADILYDTTEVALGELMAFIDMTNRWVYSGSLTTPGCNENLYWNVVKTVYPIKPHHMAYYNKLVQTLGEDKTKVKTMGNNRKVRQATAEHKLILIKGAPPATAPVTDDEVDSAQSTSLAMIILFCISMFIVLGLTVYVCILYDQTKMPADGQKPLEDKIEHGVVAQESIDASPIKGADNA